MTDTSRQAGCYAEQVMADTRQATPNCQDDLKPKDQHPALTKSNDQPMQSTEPALQLDTAASSNCYTTGVKGYGRPKQHILYQTTSADYGGYPAPPPALNNKHFPKVTKFTKKLGPTGNYTDTHFSNESDKEYVYSPPTYYY